MVKKVQDDDSFSMAKIPDVIQFKRKEGDPAIIITFSSQGRGDSTERYSFYLSQDSVQKLQLALESFSTTGELNKKLDTKRKDVH